MILERRDGARKEMNNGPDSVLPQYSGIYLAKSLRRRGEKL